jgi:hypothetical protein
VTPHEPDRITFVLCIENNATRAQALLLCASIRRFGGRYCEARIIAVAPRAGLGVDHQTRLQLDALRVEYVEEPLNRACPEYGSANRVFAAAWAEPRVRSDWLVVLDSDTVVLGEIDLPTHADVAVRPVDTKGSATEGPQDRFDDYWASLAKIQGVPLDCLPYIYTTVCRHRVRASYNGGLLAVRRDRGILAAWAELFARSVAEGLRPWRGSGLNVYASTGLVGEDASEYWGSNQAAASLAIWSRTKRVVHYPDSYNVPLHLLFERPDLTAFVRSSPPVHVHYHWLFTAPHHERALAALRTLGVDGDRIDWLAARVPLR